MAEPAQHGVFSTLISADELNQHIDRPDWIIIDCRHDLADAEAGKRAFDDGHLPHARFAHLDHDLSGAKTGSDGSFRGRHPLPGHEDFIAVLRAWGVDNDTQVIAYDAHGGMFAARLWWLCRWAGHARAAVLDGGMAAWERAGLALSTVSEKPVHAQGNFTGKQRQASTVSADDILGGMADRKLDVIDARAPERYRGENETLDPVGGHIPGATNRFFKNNLQADGRFKNARQLREEFSALIADPARAVMQCGSGVTACHHLLALEIAGMPGAALYPGSWSEWCADPARPVAVGDRQA